MSSQPKAPFYIAVLLVVGGLIAFAVYRSKSHSKPDDQPVAKRGAGDQQIDPGKLTGTGTSGHSTGAEGQSGGPEAPDTAGITTVKEYTFKPSERLPAVKGVAGYQKMQ